MVYGVEIPRDGYGRPLVMSPDGEKRHAYQRVTTFVGVLENTWNIQQWEARKIAEGMGRRPDLVLAAAAADPDDKKALQEIASKAKEHALGSSAATTGTALHSLTQRVDEGGRLGSVPDSAVADIEAYERATAGIEFLGIEEFRVHDDWRIAGTADRRCRYRGEKIIADIKTGSIEFGQGKIAMQLAMYAHSTPYDIASDTRGEIDPDLDLTKALIIHLPAGQAQCHLVWVDIERGWAACALARQVWAWRKARNLTWEWEHDDNEGLSSLPLMSIQACTTLGELRDIWNACAENGSLTAGLKMVMERRSRELKASA